ncbi:hypothetical protein PYCC9005_002875 [Savitreella phatthalungensis]
MSLLANLAGWSAFGMLTRSFQLALQRKSQTETLHVTGVYAAVFGGVGYYLYNAEQRQKVLLQEKKEALLESRARRAAAASDA